VAGVEGRCQRKLVRRGRRWGELDMNEARTTQKVGGTRSGD